VKPFVWLLLLTSAVCADEAADRPAIARTIASLNEFPQRDEIFTADADGRTALNELWKGKGNGVSASSSGLPMVVISHEPWGEATLYFPGIGPRMVSREIRFVSPDVALVDGVFTEQDGNGQMQTKALLLVMKKLGKEWKIAAVRIVAAQ
jgi:hypothetical protein